jgi:hypothetical protein
LNESFREKECQMSGQTWIEKWHVSKNQLSVFFSDQKSSKRPLVFEPDMNKKIYTKICQGIYFQYCYIVWKKVLITFIKSDSGPLLEYKWSEHFFALLFTSNFQIVWKQTYTFSKCLFKSFLYKLSLSITEAFLKKVTFAEQNHCQSQFLTRIKQ